MVIKNNHLLLYALRMIIHAGIYIFFVLKVFRNKFRHKFSTTIAVSIGYLIFFTIGALIFIDSSTAIYLEYKIIALPIMIAITILLSIFCIKTNITQLLFIIFVIFGNQHNAIFISYALCDIANIPPLLGFENGNVLLLSIIMQIVFIPIMWYLFVVMFKRVVDGNVNFTYWKNLFVMPIVYLAFIQIHTLTYKTPITRDYSVFELIQLMLLSVFSYLSYVATLNMMLKTRDILEAEGKINAMQRQILLQKEQYDKLGVSLEKTSRLRHDWRQHLIAIKGLFASGDLAEVEKYLNNYTNEYLVDNTVSFCENYSINTILRHYMAIANYAGVKCKVLVDIPNELPFVNSDLCIIIGNLIENAVDSCITQKNGEKFIDIQVKNVDNKMLAIAIKNSYNGEIKRKGDEFLSSKHDGLGIGISSVKNIVQKIGGSCRFTFTDSVFRAHVLIHS